MLPNTYAIIGCSTTHDYDFPVVLTSLLWRERIGIEPYLLLIGDEAEWEKIGRCRTVIEYLKWLNIRHSFIGRHPDYYDSCLVQNARQHAAVLDFKHDDYLITSDADLFPLRPAYYTQFNPDKRMTFWYANAYGYAYHCTCHVGAKASVWRQVMDLTQDGNILPQVVRTLDRDIRSMIGNKPLPQASDEQWHSDEKNTSARIKKHAWYPGECQMIERPGHPPRDRADRSNWPTGLAIERFTDAHILRPAQYPENWPKVLALFGELLPDRKDVIIKFHEKYMQGYE